MNSEDDTLKSQKVDESMKSLIMEYIKAQNDKRFSDAERSEEHTSELQSQD